MKTILDVRLAVWLLCLACLPRLAAAIATSTTCTSPAVVAINDPVTLMAQVSAISSGLPITGTVSFYFDSILIASAMLQNKNGTFQAAIGVSFIADGVHEISCSYNGDFNYEPSTSSDVSVFFGAGKPIVTLSSSLNPSAAGQNVSITIQVAVVEPQSAFATGNVVLKDGGNAVATLPLQGSPLENAMAVYTTAMLSPGRHTFTASYFGDNVTAAGDSTTPLAQVVTQNVSATTIDGATPNPAEYGQMTTFSVAVDGPKNTAGLPTPTGTVSLVEGQSILASAQLIQGKASLAISTILPGHHSLTASYGGDANFSGSVSAPVSFEVTKAETAIQLTGSPDPAPTGIQVTLTAILQSNAGVNPTGTVSFQDGNVPIGSPVSISGGAALLSTASLSPGAHMLTAVYSGDQRLSSSVSSIFVENIQAPIMVSSATGLTKIAPDSIASIYGLGFTATQQSAAGLPLPLTLGGVSITIQDSSGAKQPIPLIFVSPGQVNCVLPPSIRAGPATISITTSLGQLQTGQLEVTRVAPGIYSADGSGHGPAAAIAVTAHADGSRTSSPVFRCSMSACTTVPIDVGTEGDKVVLVLFGTGIRKAASGSVKIAIGDLTLTPPYAGAQSQFPGLDQVNVALPKKLAGQGEQNVSVVDGNLRSNLVTIALK